MRILITAGLLAAWAGGPAAAQPAPGDPLSSVMWDTVHATVLDGGPVVFDDAHVRVFTPFRVEDSQRVPVSVRLDGLENVRAIVVLADHNPIPKALGVFPAGGVVSFVEVSIKVNEATPIRVAAKTADGVWHVGGQRVDAAGGGCSAPRPAQASKEWEDGLNGVTGRAGLRPDGGVRLQWRIVHPMDTGLVEGIPSFHVESVTIAAGGRSLVRLEPTAAVAENPVLTVDLPDAAADQDIVITGRDTDGNPLAARIKAPGVPHGRTAGGRS